MMRKSLLALIAIVVLGIPSLQAQSGVIESRIKEVPFKALSDIAVLVESLGPEGAKAGISKEELKAFVELKLRQSGVGVREMSQYTLESPYLYINVNLVYVEKIDHFIYSADASLRQTVRLLRNDTTVTAMTWHKGMVAIIPRDKARANIKDSVDSLLTFFLNEYLAANPKARK